MRRAARRQLGLTLMELILGLAGLSFMGLAIASMMAATGSAWRTRDDHHMQTRSAQALSVRLSQWVRQSRRIAGAHAGSRYTDLVFWDNDDHQPDEVNLAEVRVLTWDSDAGTLTLYRIDVDPLQLDNEMVNVPQAPTTVGGSGYGAWVRGHEDVLTYPLAEGVNDFDLSLGGEPAYTYVEFALSIDGNVGAAQLVTASGRVRAPDPSVDRKSVV